MHVQDPEDRQGQDVQRDGHDRLRGTEGVRSFSGKIHCAPAGVLTTSRRRLAFLLPAVVAVVLSGPASGAIQPIVGKYIQLPRLGSESGPVRPPRASDRRTRVVVTLDPPPLAAALPSRTLLGAGPRGKIDFQSPIVRANLTRIEAAQRTAIAKIHEAIPGAKVSWRFQVLVDGLTSTCRTRSSRRC